MVWENNFLCHHCINEYIISMCLTIGKGKIVHLQLLICRTQFSYWVQEVVQVSTSNTVRILSQGQSVALSVDHPRVPPEGTSHVHTEAKQCPFRLFQDASPSVLKPGWNALCIPKQLKKHLLENLSLGRDLTSSAVVSKAQTDPELWCFN